jgi:hypothetical protein
VALLALLPGFEYAVGRRALGTKAAVLCPAANVAHCEPVLSLSKGPDLSLSNGVRKRS